MINTLHKFAASESGSTILEFGVVLGLFGIIAIGWLPRLLLR